MPVAKPLFNEARALTSARGGVIGHPSDLGTARSGPGPGSPIGITSPRSTRDTARGFRGVARVVGAPARTGASAASDRVSCSTAEPAPRARPTPHRSLGILAGHETIGYHDPGPGRGNLRILMAT